VDEFEFRLYKGKVFYGSVWVSIEWLAEKGFTESRGKWTKGDVEYLEVAA